MTPATVLPAARRQHPRGPGGERRAGQRDLGQTLNDACETLGRLDALALRRVDPIALLLSLRHLALLFWLARATGVEPGTVARSLATVHDPLGAAAGRLGLDDLDALLALAGLPAPGGGSMTF